MKIKKIQIIMVSLFLIYSQHQVFAGPNCGGCPGAKNKKKTCNMNNNQLTWKTQKLQGSDLVIVKIFVTEDSREKLKTSLEKRFIEPIKKGQIKLMEANAQLWVRTDRAKSNEIEAFLSEEVKKSRSK